MNAVLAIIISSVSLVIAAVSLFSAWKIAERQQTFELRRYRLGMLDPAKGTLRRILIDSNRVHNLSRVHGGLSPQGLDDLKKLDREAVNTFHAISHHLPHEAREALDAMRAALERKWLQEPQHERFAVTFAHDMKAYVDAILQAVEAHLQTLLNDP